MTATAKTDAPTEAKETETESKVLSILESVVSKLDSFESRLNDIEQSAPKVVRSAPPTSARDNAAGTYLPPEQLRKRAMMSLEKDGQSVAGGSSVWDDPHELAKLPPASRPAFHAGDAVVLNLDAKIHGSEKTYGDIYEQGSSIGEVMSIVYFDHTWQPKYRVIFPGITKPDGDGFRESELLPAYA